jgi:hypothetical protein
MSETAAIADLSALSELARETYPDSDLPLAIVAESRPSLLHRALNSIDAKSFTVGVAVTEAQQVYEAASTKTDKRTAAPSLYEAAQRALDVEEQYAALKGPAQLAEEIRIAQERLAQPMRMIAVVLGALVIGAGTVGDIRAHEHIRPGQEIRQSVVDTDLYEATLGTLGGGVLGLVVGTGLIGREAKRRARRIVTRTAS